MTDPSAAARQRLVELCGRLTAPGVEPAARRDAAEALSALFCRLSELDAGGPSLELADRRPVFGGQAISPLEAADCVVDSARTAAFLGGLKDAYRELDRRFPGERLRILYAGCGPFATLAVTLMASLPPGRAGFTLVDVHPASLASARRLVRALGYEGFVDGWIEGDASRVLPADGPRFHLLMVEVMQAALEKEPQVEVTRALAPRLAEGGILVPERIGVYLRRAGEGPGTAGGARELACLFGLGRTSLEPPRAAVLRIPAWTDAAGASAAVELATRIQVFGGWCVEPGEAGISVARPAPGLGRVRPGQLVGYGFREGGDPGFEFRLVPEDDQNQTL